VCLNICKLSTKAFIPKINNNKSIKIKGEIEIRPTVEIRPLQKVGIGCCLPPPQRDNRGGSTLTHLTKGVVGVEIHPTKVFRVAMHKGGGGGDPFIHPINPLWGEFPPQPPLLGVDRGAILYHFLIWVEGGDERTFNYFIIIIIIIYIITSMAGLDPHVIFLLV
jgi:hypothetical protein